MRHDNLVRAPPDTKFLGLDAHQVVLRPPRIDVCFRRRDVFRWGERDG